ncbi:hypothetical protein [Heyndrickxia oleronia]|jgi:hypothetical protein|uniref:hypothetical protein n=1 Tax=Heyndrickxia oleronia TaxID=38875 RepID=UPI0007174C49|nr:hypothetical protein [Heyndrickxia oleronia]MBU5212886.1 hypothetical protein [Heyndrickxia oleronia]MCI1592462.1 hypothetical protein [Heyndrickxia oleronia]MCI1615423.1 hypothetical protein [Heyndrickxia oleronia]MCI1746277.1 hypothetical protein [Heyndrickxia oleronia]MCI1763610.1 hypothetical protein [Heyndrickxia oleronia]
MIVVTEMKVGEYQVPVPAGLSELLADTWVKKKKTPSIVYEYERVVECRNGSFFTKLIKKEET